MAAGVRVFGGVAVRGAVAAAGAAAFLTGSQVNPARADLHAILALAALRLFDRRDRGEVIAGAVTHAAPDGRRRRRSILRRLPTQPV